MSRLLRRLRFALDYNFDSEFIVYDYLNLNAVRFLNYEDAKKFSDEQIEYSPKIMVGVTKL